MIRVRISTPAADYLRSERAYLSKFSRQAAAELLRKLHHARRMLAEYPEAGVQITPLSEIRRLVLSPYLFEYEMQADEIVILLIRHGRQQQPDIDVDEDTGFEAETDDA